jgi:hypothetical protein
MSQMRRQGNRMWSFLPLPVLRGWVGEGARAGDALGKPPPYPPPEYRGRGKEGFTDPHAIALPGEPSSPERKSSSQAGAY